jgi:hypothetical protein
VFGNACLDLLYRSCWELFRVVGAMFGVAFLDPFSLICAFDCLEMHNFRVGNACMKKAESTAKPCALVAGVEDVADMRADMDATVTSD